MYLISQHKDSKGNKICLQADTEDLYAPRVTGVHNVHLAVCAKKEKNDKRQQWVWNEDDTTLTNVATGSALFEGFNRNVIVYKFIGKHNQRWKYNIGTKRI